MAKPKRAALYVRVSTDAQTVENQISELREVAERRGWQVVEIYKDAGISGAKGRDQPPGLDTMLKAADRRKFDVVMAWAIDRLGRSLIDLFGALSVLHTTRFFSGPADGLIRANSRSPIPQTGMFALSHPADTGYVRRHSAHPAVSNCSTRYPVRR